MNLLYLTFGNNTSVHLQAAFSIYSFLGKEKQINSITIITDSPTFYTHFAQHVNIICISKEELKEWEGPHHFFWRAKIKAIEKLCHLYPNEPIVYLDTDTFLYKDIAGIKNRLANNKALMHTNEGYLSTKNSKTEKKMWRQITNKKFGAILMQKSDCMWNAGVVATPNTTNGADLVLALNICDEMCAAGVSKRLIEQYALSLALEKIYGLEAAEDFIAHYWSTKQIWNVKISDFFLKAYFAQWNDTTIIEEMGLIDKTKIPVSEKVKNTGIRLKALVDKLFPNKKLIYLKKNK